MQTKIILFYGFKLPKEFNEKYNQYFKIDNKDLWKNNLQDLKKFIDANNKRPTNIKYIKNTS